jgi:hypothetical protein
MQSQRNEFSATRHSGDDPLNENQFKEVPPILARQPNAPPKPVATFAVHSSSDGFDFSRNDAFGFKGEASKRHFDAIDSIDSWP